MIYKMFDKVLMKDGRSASIVEVYGNGDEYDVDVDIPEEELGNENSSPKGYSAQVDRKRDKSHIGTI